MNPEKDPQPVPPEYTASTPRTALARRMLVNLLLIVLGLYVVWGGFLFFVQRSMMYFPRPYERVVVEAADQWAEPIPFQTRDGLQTFWYVAPRERPAEGEAPERLWVAFNGNAQLALDWVDFVDDFGAPGDAFLLSEYPGYGSSEGAPTRRGIVETVERALPELAAHLGVEVADLESDLNVIGFSMGTASGLEFATRHPVQRVILMAPMSSTMDIAREMPMVPWPLHQVLIDRFDNRARLAELAQRDDPPAVHIFHGTADFVIPYRHGKKLADEFPTLVTFHSLENIGHDWMPDIVPDQFREAMASN